MSTTSIEETMERTITALWKLFRELDGASAQGIVILYTPEAIAETLRLTKISMEVLEGELRQAVLGDGGVHGTPEAAWAVWQELATSTGDNLTRALNYNEKFTVKGGLEVIGTVATDTGKNIAAGISTALDALKWAVIGFIAWQLFKGTRR